MKLLFWIVVFVIAAVLASFAASNRDSVALALWPLPFVAALPVYLAMLGALCLGAILGALAASVSAARWRREARRRGRRLAALQREIAAARDQPPASTERLPALAGRR